MKLSKAQSKTVRKMADGQCGSAYSLQVSLATLNALVEKGILHKVSGVGFLFSPRTAIKYRLKRPISKIADLLCD